MFCADLCRMLEALHVPVKVEFLCVKSYGTGTVTSGEVQLLLDMREQVVGQHILLVEDIIDSAVTMQYLKKLLLNRGPASLKTVVLLDKPDRRKVQLDADYVVVQIPNEFVIGYGMDFAERYRGLKDVCVLKPSYYMPKEAETTNKTRSKL
ncbi:hypoxanthine phosphoribosyltransferase [Strigomonas culicis]|nr:hypoxanthine phosphoribosyltransferase [Strigomonas culicis]|eukprot:EPY34597.1 hypoxanthine phosphoribosyltransferase [Strigomonas culicis]